MTNRRAIRAILRSPIYGANETTEMELGIKKISTTKQKKYLKHDRKIGTARRDITQQNILTSG